MNRERILAVVRIIALFVTAINALLTAKGINPIPFDENLVAETACYVVAGITAIWAWWKHNYITQRALDRKKRADIQYNEEVDASGVDEIKEDEVQ